MALHHHQRPVEIGRVIGRNAEFAAGLHLGRDQGERPVVHHPPLGMARLGPGVGMQQIDHRQRPVRQPAEHVERIAHVDPDIGQPLVADMAERLGDAIEERLAADEAMVGQQVGAIGEMLAAAEADLEMQRAVIAEQPLGGDFPLGGHRNRRQQRLHQLRLALAQLVAARPAVKPVEGRRVALLVRGHGRAPLRRYRPAFIKPMSGCQPIERYAFVARRGTLVLAPQAASATRPVASFAGRDRGSGRFIYAPGGQSYGRSRRWSSVATDQQWPRGAGRRRP